MLDRISLDKTPIEPQERLIYKSVLKKFSRLGVPYNDSQLAHRRDGRLQVESVPLLLLGTDARISSRDCRISGPDCSEGPRQLFEW
jgi:hypothetical protein